MSEESFGKPSDSSHRPAARTDGVTDCPACELSSWKRLARILTHVADILQKETPPNPTLADPSATSSLQQAQEKHVRQPSPISLGTRGACRGLDQHRSVQLATFDLFSRLRAMPPDGHPTATGQTHLRLPAFGRAHAESLRAVI